MKKTNLIKVVSILLISAMVVLFNTSVFAANENDGFTDLTSTLNSSANNTSNNANANNSNTNTNTNNTNSNSNSNSNSNTNKSNTNTSSIYNNTNLPKTGVESSIPVAMLVVIFGISAVYAYKKINEYKNI